VAVDIGAGSHGKAALGRRRVDSSQEARLRGASIDRERLRRVEPVCLGFERSGDP